MIGQRLDAAIDRLEALMEGYEKLLSDYEEADFDYDRQFLLARAKSLASSQPAKDADAKQQCIDLGVDSRRRAAKVRVDAVRFNAQQLRAIIDGLRTQSANERSLV